MTADDDNKPYYGRHVFCCINERPLGHKRGCCLHRGGDGVQKYMKARVKQEGIENIRINKSGCLDRCELGPVVVVYPEGVWYTCQTREDVDEIIERHIKGGEIVARLALANDQEELRPEQKSGGDA